MRATRRLVIGTTIAEQLSTSFFPHLAAFADAGWEVHLVCAPGEWPSGPPPVDVAVHRIPMSKTISAGSDARALAAWVSLLRELAPDAVIGASPKGGLLAMTAGRIARVPRRIFLHRGARWETLAGAQRRITVAAERATCANATDVVAVSNSLASLVVAEGIARRRPVVLGAGGSKGVDLQRFRPAPDGAEGSAPTHIAAPSGSDAAPVVAGSDPVPVVAGSDAAPVEVPVVAGSSPAPTLGFVGRLARDKGLDVVMAAFDSVRAAYPDARLVIAGDVDSADPPPPDVLERLDTDPGVALLGWRADLESIIPTFDVLVFPSAREGLPNAVLESAACGVPTVGWDVTGVRDAISDGTSGRLVPWRDVAAFAAAVRELAVPADRQRWRERSRRWAQRFDGNRVTRLWVELLELPPGRVPNGAGAGPGEGSTAIGGRPTAAGTASGQRDSVTTASGQRDSVTTASGQRDSVTTASGPSGEAASRSDRLGVAIVAYRSQATIGACLTSLAAHAPGAHVVVVDNSGEAEALRAIAAALLSPLGSLRIEDAGGNLGYARAVNRAVELLPPGCEYLLILNPDVQLIADPLVLIDRLEHADVTAGRLRGPMSNAKREVTYASVLRGALLGSRSLGVELAPGGGDLQVPHLDGAYLLQRLDYYRAHPMDEAFELYYEDADYCDRARAGRGVLLADLDVGDHIGGASSGGSTMSVTAYTAARVSRARYLHRRYPRFGGAALAAPFALERLVRAATRQGEGADARRAAWRAVRAEIRQPGAVAVLDTEAGGQPALGQPALGQPALGQPALGQPALEQLARGQAPVVPPAPPAPASQASPQPHPPSSRPVSGARAPLTALTPYGPQTASTRVRVREWIARTGIDACVIDYAGLPKHSLGTLARNAPAVARAERRQRALAHEHFERLLIHKEVTPFSSGDLAERLVARADFSVYDFDDAIMWTDQLGADARWSAAGMAKRVWSKARACERTVMAVDRVIAGSDLLAEWAAERNRDVWMIPSCVDTGIYPAKPTYELGATPTLVWLGSPATEYNLALVAEPLLRLHAATGARLAVISGPAADLGPLAAMADRIPWRPGIEATLGDYDLGIAPLTDSPYERGKCAYKILQYAAAGLPVVGSPVGANAKVLADLGQRAAGDASAWVDACTDVLRATSADRAAVGDTARAAVVSGYSFEAWTPRWLSAVGEPIS